MRKMIHLGLAIGLSYTSSVLAQGVYQKYYCRSLDGKEYMGKIYHKDYAQDGCSSTFDSGARGSQTFGTMTIGTHNYQQLTMSFKAISGGFLYTIEKYQEIATSMSGTHAAPESVNVLSEDLNRKRYTTIWQDDDIVCKAKLTRKAPKFEF